MKFGLAALLVLVSADPNYTQDDLEEHCVPGDPLFYEDICEWFIGNKPVVETTRPEEEEEEPATTATIQTIQPFEPEGSKNGSSPITSTSSPFELSTMQR